MLGLIGLEIYLKVAVLIETGKRPRSHAYWEIWQLLPEATRDRILESAKIRVAGHADLEHPEKFFCYLRRAFEKGRYSYEANDARSEEQAREDGSRWAENGAPIEDADFAYVPMERFALVHALREFCSVRVV